MACHNYKYNEIPPRGGVLKKISSQLLWKFINPPSLSGKVMFLGMVLYKYRLVLAKLTVPFFTLNFSALFFSAKHTK